MFNQSHFYPRPPRGGRLAAPGHDGLQFDFYPRPPRGGRRFSWFFFFGIFAISIHALREEGDHRPAQKAADRPRISIHALREEGDREQLGHVKIGNDFYPRPPRGGRHEHHKSCGAMSLISIHALREEGDGRFSAVIAPASVFLSTPSARRATLTLRALLAEPAHFYPRPPRGGRPAS